MKKNIATVVSRIFDPFIMLAVVFVVLVSHTQVFVPAFVSMVLVPLVLYIIAWKTKFVSNWDMSDRRERPKILWPLVVIEVICISVFQLSSIIPMLAAIIGFAIITQFWKISGHAMGAALATGTIVARFGWGWWPVLLIVPLVCWARVVRRDHTIWQVIAGAAYSWIITSFL
jgi:small-conductance mechanosensitive channel